MKSIKRKFINLLEKHPDWSTFTCFTETVYEQNFNRDSICTWFNRLVDKEDYDLVAKKEILKFLNKATKPKKKKKKKKPVTIRIVYSDRCYDPDKDPDDDEIL
jgi:hypothetical protein